MAEAIWAKYKGDGTSYLYGVPARDLTEEDRAALTREQREAVAHTRLANGKPLYDVRERESRGSTDDDQKKPRGAADKDDDDQKPRGAADKDEDDQKPTKVPGQDADAPQSPQDQDADQD